jgi:hypothetical protein
MSKKNRNKNASVIPQEVEQTTIDTAVEEVVTEETPIVDEQQNEIEAPVIEEPEEQNADLTETAEEPEELAPAVEETPVVVTEPVKKETINKPVNKGILKVEMKAAPAKSVVSIPQTEGVVRFTAIGKKYLELMTGVDHSDESRRRAIVVLTNMCNLVCSSNDPAVFDTCFRFFMENRKYMLAPSTVISGIEKVVEKSKIAKIVQFYTVFQTLVECKLLKSRFTLNITTIRRLLGNDALANWLIAKRG